MRKAIVLNAAAGLAAIAAAWLLVFQPRLELAGNKLDHAQQQLDQARALDAERVAVIEAQAGQLAGVLQAELKNRELLGQIASQNREQTAALQELKRNDATIAEYLRSPVPAGLGRLYQRTETTDPAAYRSQTSLPTDSVRYAGPDDDRHE